LKVFERSKIVFEKRLFRIEHISENLLAAIQSRDVSLWVGEFPSAVPTHIIARLLRLPWRLIVSEAYDATILNAVSSADQAQDPLTRKRGFVQIIDSDPSRIQLPDRCLPIYLLNGKTGSGALTTFNARLRRLTMLESFRRDAPREIVIISNRLETIPPDLKDLWSSGFRSHLTLIAEAPNAGELLKDWLQKSEGVAHASLLTAPAEVAIEEFVSRYHSNYSEERHVIRVRDLQGTFHPFDVTEADDPERPISEFYSLIEERDLAPLSPQELSEEEFVSFFRDTTSSLRPYAAGLPWIRNIAGKQKLLGHLKKLDSSGAEANCIAYITSESGAGGTTYARALAWECASQGYPVLLAKSFPFIPDALPVANFLTRVQNSVETLIPSAKEARDLRISQREGGTRRYEAPWIIVFDSLHWQYRDSELVRFRNELEKSGRPVCLLMVSGPYLSLEFMNSSIFKKLAELNHSIELDEARQLGEHFNRYLRNYGKQRERWQWDRFYEDHTIKYVEGIAAFWVALSFWIQGQYDLTESIQEWMYRCFKQKVKDPIIKDALLRIAALSSERLPLPDVLLPAATGQWPVSVLLTDSRSDLAALGLVRISSEKGKYWSLAHDILGRFLINALFYDYKEREGLGFSEARDPDHLRFLLLRQISQEPILGERVYRAIGEDFATSIFKVDQEHGHGAFMQIWREVLTALDEMPRSLRDTSRLFRHHCAVSRRRVAKLEEMSYNVSLSDRLALLNRAIEDIKYALEFIEYTPGSESNLNLYNSLANAYLDLAEAEGIKGSSRERLVELRTMANEATRKAYAESPTNSFVIETYVKNLLQEAKHYSEQPAEKCVEALSILFSALSSNEAGYRAMQLGTLADQALRILLDGTPDITQETEPKNAIDVLVETWKALTDVGIGAETGLFDLPESNRERALQKLRHPAGRGNMQVIRLTYDLICLNRPSAFREQLELVEQLTTSEYRLTPQLRLEYALLLFQNARSQEGEKVFRFLRQLWRESDHFVQVPERLRWLRLPDGNLQTVHANIGTDHGLRASARVHEFGSSFVPFRPEEFGFRTLIPGQRFSCHVSFGHNGPFLRPLTAGPRDLAGG
jgi:hypothetical protein